MTTKDRTFRAPAGWELINDPREDDYELYWVPALDIHVSAEIRDGKLHAGWSDADGNPQYDDTDTDSWYLDLHDDAELTAAVELWAQGIAEQQAAATTGIRAHQLANLVLYDVHRGGETGIVRVQTLPPHLRVVTVLAPTGSLATGDEIHDRGVTMRVTGRAPWADTRAAKERPDLAEGRDAWTLHRVLGGELR